MPELIEKHGVMVEDGMFRAGEFIRNFSTRVGANSYFDGTWEELEALVTAYRDDYEPGDGSVDDDVILVNVPAAGFYSSVIAITEENADSVEVRVAARREGEAPVESRVIQGEKPPAKYAQVVCYRADTLARDDGRSTNAEWELIAVLAQDVPRIPMHPHTMLRNANHEVGGTYREYTEEQWAEAYAYWDSHAYIETVA